MSRKRKILISLIVVIGVIGVGIGYDIYAQNLEQKAIEKTKIAMEKEQEEKENEEEKEKIEKQNAEKVKAEQEKKRKEEEVKKQQEIVKQKQLEAKQMEQARQQEEQRQLEQVQAEEIENIEYKTEYIKQEIVNKDEEEKKEIPKEEPKKEEDIPKDDKEDEVISKYTPTDIEMQNVTKNLFLDYMNNNNLEEIALENNKTFTEPTPEKFDKLVNRFVEQVKTTDYYKNGQSQRILAYMYDEVENFILNNFLVENEMEIEIQNVTKNLFLDYMNNNNLEEIALENNKTFIEPTQEKFNELVNKFEEQVKATDYYKNGQNQKVLAYIYDEVENFILNNFLV